MAALYLIFAENNNLRPTYHKSEFQHLLHEKVHQISSEYHPCYNLTVYVELLSQSKGQ